MNAKDVLGAVRDGAATFAGLSGVVYACGYLALRARAHALGVDPGFALVNEAYVFAGFRFILTTLIVLLLSQPVVAILNMVAIRLGREERLAPIAAWTGLMVVAAAVLLQSGVLNVRDLLLTREGLGAIDRAALGQNNLGLLIFFGALISAQLVAVALLRRIRRGEAGGMSVPLAVILALQLLYLPVLQGVLFADRYVRVLDAAPRSAPGLLGRVAIVDRAKDKVSLLGVVSDHSPRIVTVNSSDLDGIGVGQIVTLSQFLKMIAVAPAAFTLSAAAPVAAQPSQTQSAVTVGEGSGPHPSAAFWQIVASQLRRTLENIGSLGESRADHGAIYVVELQANRPPSPERLSRSADFSWPVIGSHGEVFALQGQRLVRLDASGASTPTGPSSIRWLKLVGVDADAAVAGLLDSSPPFGQPALLTPDGRVIQFPAPATPDERKRQGVLLQESQSLDGGRRLVVGRSQRGGRGFDVFYSSPTVERLNISDCGDASCGQPSIAADGSRIVYIRSDQ